MTLATVALSCAKQLGRANSSGTEILDLEDEIKEQIAETIRFYNRQSYHLTEFRGAELTTVSGTTWYSSIDLTSGDGDQASAGRTTVDVGQVVTLNYMRENPGSSGFNDTMDRLSYLDFERMFEGSTPNGTPSYYTVYAGQIGIWPTPDAAYTLYFSAHIKPVVPTADDDTSVWFDEANEMIEAGALKRVCLKYLRDTQRAAEFAAIEDTAQRGLEREYTMKTSSRKLRANE